MAGLQTTPRKILVRVMNDPNNKGTFNKIWIKELPVESIKYCSISLKQLLGSFNTYSMSTRSCPLVNNMPSGFPILGRLISLNGALWTSSFCSLENAALWKASEDQSFMEQAFRRTASVQEIQVAFPLNLSHQLLNIIFVTRKTYCSFRVKYTCFVSHLYDEKTKGIFISYIL